MPPDDGYEGGIMGIIPGGTARSRNWCKRILRGGIELSDECGDALDSRH